MMRCGSPVAEEHLGRGAREAQADPVADYGTESSHRPSKALHAVIPAFAGTIDEKEPGNAGLFVLQK